MRAFLSFFDIIEKQSRFGKMSKLPVTFTDNYSHRGLKSAFYSPQNVKDTIEYIDFACDCEDICLPSTCLCLQNSGKTFNYQNGKITPKEYPIFECKSDCACGSKCQNRIVQKGPIEGLVIKDFDLKGLGLTTANSIPKGTFVCEYAGEVITMEKSQKRSTKDQHNYILHIFEHFQNEQFVTIIDPTRIGNIGRYLNHSCDPNLSIHLVRTEDWTPCVALFSNKNIEANEELTFDYGQHKKEQIQDNVNKSRPCLCGSAKCQGFLPSHQL